MGETGNLRFDLKPVRAVRISGSVSNSPGVPLIQLSHAGPDGRPESVGMCSWDNAASRFECLPVVPGEYWVDANYATPDRRGRGYALSFVAARKSVTAASADITDVDLKLQPYPDLLGRVTAADGSANVFHVIFWSIRWGAAAQETQIAPDGSFRVALPAIESYRIRLDALVPWHIQSIRQAGKDLTGGILQIQPDGSWVPVEIVVSQSHGTVDGFVRQANEEDCLVRIIELQDGVLRLVAVSNLRGEEHTFEATSLAPGEYFVLASRRGAEIPYLDAAYLAGSKDVVQVHVVDGEASHLEITPVSNDSGFVH
jgi:hypothetical protein